MSLRRSGVLCHISSLPGDWGIGDFGSGARAFIDFMQETGFTLWQTLPLTPVLPMFGNSPYSSPSTFAGNTLFISPEELCREGLISREEAEACILPSDKKADYISAAECRRTLLGSAWKNFNERRGDFADMHGDFVIFCEHERYWLRDFSLFTLLRELNNERPWTEWPREYADHDEEALDLFASENEDTLSFAKFTQFIFFRQLQALIEYARKRGVSFIGDLPIYVAWDGADVWSHRTLFDLNDDGTPRCVSGVPPDYFSKFGQRWGNPLYKWEMMREDNFDWWCSRLAHTLEYCSLLRVDHFRGLCGYWAIPAEEKTAVNGCWQPALGREMLEAFAEDQGLAYDELPIIAEDLGVITDDVVKLMEDFSLPGMNVLMFAFGKDVAVSPYAPHNITKHSIVYTGTHDNDTAVGWWNEGATPIEWLNFANYTNEVVTNENVGSIMVRMALSSVADIAVIPAQDLLGLDGPCRMNTPSTTLGNWGWRMTRSELDALSDPKNFADELKTMNLIYGRCRLGEEN